MSSPEQFYLTANRPLIDVVWRVANAQDEAAAFVGIVGDLPNADGTASTCALLTPNLYFTRDQQQAMMARVVACKEACQGMTDPGAEIAALRRDNQRLLNLKNNESYRVAALCEQKKDLMKKLEALETQANALRRAVEQSKEASK